MYWIIATVATVGYGDVAPSTTRNIELTIAEKIYSLVFIVFGVWIYTNSISFISKYMQDDM